MSTAIEYVNKFRATPDSADIDAVSLMTLLDKNSIQSDQDWNAGSTTWTFSDGSKICVEGSDVNVYGVMPNTNDTDWFFAGHSAA